MNSLIKKPATWAEQFGIEIMPESNIWEAEARNWNEPIAEYEFLYLSNLCSFRVTDRKKFSSYLSKQIERVS